MTEDTELLRRYAVEHSEAAFAELIRRHVDLVYSAALRLVNGDAHRAQDVAQQVFAEFARQAKRLMRHPAPVGWLYATTRLSALRIIRTEQRRSAREQEVTTMNELLGQPAAEPDWTRLRPVLEDAMHELGEKDRHAVLLRFFQNKSLKEVGMALDLGENAARMRVDRALEKLRAALVRRGIAATSTLAAVISANAVQTAPATLTATLTTASVATAGIGTFTLLKIMTTTQLKLGISVLVVAGVTTSLVVQRQAQAKLRDENESLRLQVSHLRAESEDWSNRLSVLGASQKLSAGQSNELLKLRGEVGLLRERTNEFSRQLNSKITNSGLEPGKVPSGMAPPSLAKAQWAFAGSTTAEAAVQSELWAASNGDTNTMLSLMTPEDRKDIEENWDSFSNGLSNGIAILNSVRSFSILGKKAISDNEVMLNLYFDGNGTNWTEQVPVERLDNEWKVLSTTETNN